MNIVFLDVDGVLNDCSSPHMGNMDELVYFKGEAFLRRSLLVLKRIVSSMSAKVVISSSWRYDKDLMYSLLSALKYYRIDAIDITPDYKTYAGFGTCRGDEIVGWLKSTREQIDNFVILDDFSDMNHVKRHLIKTSTNHGLDEKHYKDFVYRFSKGEFCCKMEEYFEFSPSIIAQIESFEVENSLYIKNMFEHCAERVYKQHDDFAKQVRDYGFK